MPPDIISRALLSQLSSLNAVIEGANAEGFAVAPFITVDGLVGLDIKAPDGRTYLLQPTHK